MRTFMFIKNERDNYGQTHKIVKGMVMGDMYPSGMTGKGDKYEYCDCIELTERCCIDLGVFKY